MLHCVFLDLNTEMNAQPSDIHANHLPIFQRKQPVSSHSPLFCVQAIFLANGVNSPINIVFFCCLPTHCFQMIRQDYSTGFTINPLILFLLSFPHRSLFFSPLQLSFSHLPNFFSLYSLSKLFFLQNFYPSLLFIWIY